MGQKTPQSEHASLQLTDGFILRLGMLLGQRLAQERGGCRHRCPAAEVGRRDTGAIARGLPMMLKVQKGQRFPAKYQLSGWAARLSRHNPCQHSSLQSPGITSLPTAPACPGPSANAFQLLQMGAKKGQNQQIKLFYAQLAAKELLSAFSALTSPLCLLVPDD